MDSEKIKKFLIEHPLISIRALEKEAGIPQTLIAGFLCGTRIKIGEKHIPSIVNVLKNYGYEGKS